MCCTGNLVEGDVGDCVGSALRCRAMTFRRLTADVSIIELVDLCTGNGLSFRPGLLNTPNRRALPSSPLSSLPSPLAFIPSLILRCGDSRRESGKWRGDEGGG